MSRVSVVGFVSIILVSFLASAAWCDPVCQVDDYFIERAQLTGEAEIVRMFTVDPAEPDILKCEFIKGEEIGFYIAVNDWPGGELTIEAKVFYCGFPDHIRCVLPDVEFGYVNEGDVNLILIATAPERFPGERCEVDWAVRIFLDGAMWDIGGMGELEPGFDLGPDDDCGCIAVVEGSGCPSMVGEWTLNYYWNGTCTLWFYEDGTFYSGGSGSWGTWIQDGCDVEWTYESGTHYWGVMETGGDYMSGEMLSYSGSTGTWNATRN